MTKKEKVSYIIAELEKLYPSTPVPLNHTDTYTLLIAVLLSAQCTDERVNKITPKLFHLPFFNGKNSYKNANVILSLIRKSDVSINYISFSFIDNRRWNINLNNGVKILLPETNIIDTLKLLKKIDSEHNILKGNFIEIDLRIYKKFFLKPKIN